VPNYEYRCADCDNRYEKREGFEAPSTQSCPRCGGRARRVLFAPPIVFKGSGFYVTDSRKNGDSATVGGDTSTSSGNTSSTTAASEPAAATASSDDD
jgi:putative FmdB family regulatory protein